MDRVPVAAAPADVQVVQPFASVVELVNVALAHAAVRQTLLRLGRSGAADQSQKKDQNHGTDKSGDQ